MANTLINTHFEHYKSLIDEIFGKLHHLTLNIGNSELSETVDNIRSRLGEPFLFVIVGEVKVGKSSFVNALLQTDKEVCKVAPDPCTDTIQQIVYGDLEAVIPINEHLKKITLPIEILRQVAIVDTPGTNTIIEHHTEITEKFIPVSDLIIFIFEAKNPYRQSAWQFFDYISQQWRKKVIFVLQQADLMEPDDLAVNLAGVTKHAIQKGLNDPKVFAVSAKLEQKGQTEISGFTAVRNYINETITGGNNTRLKVQSLLSTSKKIMTNISEGLILRKQQIEADEQFRNKVDLLLDNAEGKTDKQVNNLIDNVLNEYDSITTNISQEFQDGLGTFTLLKKSVLSIFDREASMKEWIEQLSERLEKELKPALERKLTEGVMNIADSIGQMAEIIDAEIRKNKSGIKSNNQVFADIANRRQDKLQKLQLNLESMVNNTSSFVNNDALRQSSAIVPNLATGGGLAIIGGVLAAATTTSAMDITGGILAGISLIGAGIVTSSQRKRVIKEFKQEISKGRLKLSEQMNEKLSSYTKEIRIKIDNNFLEFDTFLHQELKNFNSVADEFKNVQQQFNKLVQELSIEV